jgi:hypothetical protein
MQESIVLYFLVEQRWGTALKRYNFQKFNHWWDILCDTLINVKRFVGEEFFLQIRCLHFYGRNTDQRGEEWKVRDRGVLTNRNANRHF